MLTDPTARHLLEAIADGDLDSVPILADRLEELGDDRAGKVRKASEGPEKLYCHPDWLPYGESDEDLDHIFKTMHRANASDEEILRAWIKHLSSILAHRVLALFPEAAPTVYMPSA